MLDLNDAGELYAQGRSALEVGDIERALERFHQSIRISAHFKTLELLGECLLLKNQHSEAIVYLAASAGLGLKQSRSRFLLAQAQIAIGETADARDQLKEALRLNPNYRAASKLLGALADDEGRSQQKG